MQLRLGQIFNMVRSLFVVEERSQPVGAPRARHVLQARFLHHAEHSRVRHAQMTRTMSPPDPNANVLLNVYDLTLKRMQAHLLRVQT